MTTFGSRAAAWAVALLFVACGGSMAEKSDPVKDPAHLAAEPAPVSLAPDLTATERVIQLGPVEGAEPPAEHHHAEPAPSAADPPTTKTLYTCPMHAEVARDRPGTCPKCGMKLVRKAGTP